MLWTRLAPDPLEGGGMPMSNVDVGWEIASDRALRTVTQKGNVIARPELGHSVRVEVSGLDPGHEYWYRFHSGSEVSQVGRTKTAPADGAPVEKLRFAVCGCNHFETGYFTAFRRIAAEQFDFVFHTGDYIYENRADGGKNPALVRQHQGDEIYTIVDYRNRYAQYKSIPICGPRTPPPRSSSRGTITRWTTTMPATWTRGTRRRRSSCSAARPRTRLISR